MNIVIIVTLCRPLKFLHVVLAVTDGCVSAKREWVEKEILTLEQGTTPVCLSLHHYNQATFNLIFFVCSAVSSK